MTMKKFGGKFALIIGLTLLGLWAIYPPSGSAQDRDRPLGRDDPSL